VNAKLTVSQKLLTALFLTALVAPVPAALYSELWDAQAQVPPAPKQGQTLTVTSFEGVATQVPANKTKIPGSPGRDKGASDQPQTPSRQPPREEPVSLQLTWRVTKVNPDGSWAFNITAGAVTLGGESYNVETGRGFVTKSGVVHWRLVGNYKGERFSWGCSGLLSTLNGQIVNGMSGILRKENEHYNIRFLATIK